MSGHLALSQVILTLNRSVRVYASVKRNLLSDMRSHCLRFAIGNRGEENRKALLVYC